MQHPHSALTAFLSVVAAVAVGCGNPPQNDSATVTATVAPQINSGTFQDMQRLDDKFIATILALPAVRSEMMERRDQSNADLTSLAHDLCTHVYSQTAPGNTPADALAGAGNYVNVSMYIDGEPLSPFVRETFARAAARIYCPDNPAGVK